MTKELIPIDAGSLYEIRMVILLETSPQSNTYCKFELNREQYKKISLFIQNELAFKNEDCMCGNPNCKTIKTSDDTYVLPDIKHIV